MRTFGDACAICTHFSSPRNKTSKFRLSLTHTPHTHTHTLGDFWAETRTAAAPQSIGLRSKPTDRLTTAKCRCRIGRPGRCWGGGEGRGCGDTPYLPCFNWRPLAKGLKPWSRHLIIELALARDDKCSFNAFRDDDDVFLYDSPPFFGPQIVTKLNNLTSWKAFRDQKHYVHRVSCCCCPSSRACARDDNT